KPEEAEPVLRECLALRQKKRPDIWTTFDAQSLLGGALLAQKKYAEAEPLLREGYEGLRQRQDRIPDHGKARVTEALERLAQLYDAWDRPVDAAKWRKELDEAKAAVKTKAQP